MYHISYHLNPYEDIVPHHQQCQLKVSDNNCFSNRKHNSLSYHGKLLTPADVFHTGVASRLGRRVGDDCAFREADPSEDITFNEYVSFNLRFGTL